MVNEVYILYNNTYKTVICQVDSTELGSFHGILTETNAEVKQEGLIFNTFFNLIKCSVREHHCNYIL